MSNGLQFITSYTWGHAMANTGTTLSGSNNFQTISNINYGLDYSSAAWDIRNNFTTGLTYDLPFGRGKQFGGNMNKAVDLALGNWQVNTILTLHSGQPYTVSAGGCQGVWAGCFPDISGRPQRRAFRGPHALGMVQHRELHRPRFADAGHYRRQHELRTAAS